jgi:hypothetical protein
MSRRHAFHTCTTHHSVASTPRIERAWMGFSFCLYHYTLRPLRGVAFALETHDTQMIERCFRTVPTFWSWEMGLGLEI